MKKGFAQNFILGSDKNTGISTLDFTNLTIFEQKSIKGGDWIDDWFTAIFDTSLLPTTSVVNGITVTNFHNIQVLDIFKASFRDLASTSMGKHYFEDIKNSIQSGGKIILSPDDPTNNNASASYDPANNKMYIGKFDTVDPIYATRAAAHELYHADIVENYVFDGGDVRQEINAEIFAATTARLYDQDHNIASTSASSHYGSFFSYAPAGSSWYVNLANGIYKAA
jgi:hypothetical protein